MTGEQTRREAVVANQRMDHAVVHGEQFALRRSLVAWVAAVGHRQQTRHRHVQLLRRARISQRRAALWSALRQWQLASGRLSRVRVRDDQKTRLTDDRASLVRMMQIRRDGSRLRRAVSAWCQATVRATCERLKGSVLVLRAAGSSQHNQQGLERTFMAWRGLVSGSQRTRERLVLAHWKARRAFSVRNAWSRWNVAVVAVNRRVLIVARSVGVRDSRRRRSAFLAWSTVHREATAKRVRRNAVADFAALRDRSQQTQELLHARMIDLSTAKAVRRARRVLLSVRTQLCNLHYDEICRDISDRLLVVSVRARALAVRHTCDSAKQASNAADCVRNRTRRAHQRHSEPGGF